MARFLDHDVIGRFATDAFLATEPFPYAGIDRIVRDDAFAALMADFPDLGLFTWHGDIDRVYGQRPHNRWYLAYEAKRYDEYEERSGGVAARSDLPAVWVDFVDELSSDPVYAEMIAACLGRSDLTVRFAWHVGVTGSEVSPHVDDHNKAGTHIFYFNTSDDWRPEWGGRTLVLGGKRVPGGAPDYGDFADVASVELIGNCSFLFRNRAEAWHGVRPLTCPEGRYRRLFNVIYEHPGGAPPFAAPAARSSRWGRARSSLRRR